MSDRLPLTPVDSLPDSEKRTPPTCGYCSTPLDSTKAVDDFGAVFGYEHLHRGCFQEIAAAKRAVARLPEEEPTPTLDYEELARVSELLVDLDGDTPHTSVSSHVAALIEEVKAMRAAVQTPDEIEERLRYIEAECKTVLRSRTEADPPFISVATVEWLIAQLRSARLSHSAGAPTPILDGIESLLSKYDQQHIVGVDLYDDLHKLLRAARSQGGREGTDQ